MMQLIQTLDFEDNPCYAVVINDTEITNPFLSECGRFDVNPSTYYGLSTDIVEQLKQVNNLE